MDTKWIGGNIKTINRGEGCCCPPLRRDRGASKLLRKPSSDNSNAPMSYPSDSLTNKAMKEVAEWPGG